MEKKREKNWDISSKRGRLGPAAKRAVAAVYILLRFLVILTMVAQFFNGDYESVFPVSADPDPAAAAHHCGAGADGGPAQHLGDHHHALYFAAEILGRSGPSTPPSMAGTPFCTPLTASSVRPSALPGGYAQPQRKLFPHPVPHLYGGCGLLLFHDHRGAVGVFECGMDQLFFWICRRTPWSTPFPP